MDLNLPWRAVDRGIWCADDALGDQVCETGFGDQGREYAELIAALANKVWRDVSEKPPKDGFYFCWHDRWGRCVMGYRNYGDPGSAWGPFPPLKWMEYDGLPVEYPGRLTNGGAEVLTK